MVSEVLDFVLGPAQSIVVAAGFGGWQIWRFKRPFRAYVESSKNGFVEVGLRRRWWFSWPEYMKKYHVEFKDRHGNSDIFAEVPTARINANDPDADEQVIEAVLFARQKIAQWSKDDDEAARLAAAGKRALKR